MSDPSRYGGPVPEGAWLADAIARDRGRTNYVRFVKVDLEARERVERVPRASPQRIRRRDPQPRP